MENRRAGGRAEDRRTSSRLRVGRSLARYTWRKVSASENYGPKLGARRGRFAATHGRIPCQPGKRVLSLHVRGGLAKVAGCGYILTLQSLTGNLRRLESRA
jgi:hypothetical protein